jgi:hypothetical protein
MASYLPDGYTRDDGYIAAAIPEASGERFWDALEFTYRPATRQEWVTLDASVKIALQNENFDPTCAYKAEQLACKFVADHVVGWSLKINGIHPIPVNQNACEHMHSGLFGRIYAIIRGNRASDPKPPATEAPKTDIDLLKN